MLESLRARESLAAMPEEPTYDYVFLDADKTGYPVEMLELGMDMEADLGIDSIKRVEIMGTFRQRAGSLS